MAFLSDRDRATKVALVRQAGEMVLRKLKRVESGKFPFLSLYIDGGMEGVFRSYKLYCDLASSLYGRSTRWYPFGVVAIPRN